MPKAAKCRLGDLPIEKHGKTNGYECNTKKNIATEFLLSAAGQGRRECNKIKRHPGSNTDCVYAMIFE